MRMTAEWYKSEVKPKENRDWTDEEKKLILSLREEHHSSQEIAKMLNVSVVMVYNQTRLARRGTSKQCFACGNPLTEDEQYLDYTKFVKLCFSCKEKLSAYKSRLREHALKNHYCGYCGRRKIISGKTACRKCLSATYRRRLRKGLCGICGKNPTRKKGRSLCSSCTLLMRIKGRIYRKRHHGLQMD
jgi:hypothetical protein